MGDFQIDGIDMPKPHSYKTITHIITENAERLAGSGRLVADFRGIIYETIWYYKYLSEEDYDKIYDAYVLSCLRNNSIEHTLRTINSNDGKVLEYKIYTQADIDVPLWRYNPKTGKREYRDVTFTFVGVGGGE